MWIKEIPRAVSDSIDAMAIFVKLSGVQVEFRA